jgi:hypothetical protein
MAPNPSAATPPLPPAGIWFHDLLAELDAGANPRDLAVRVLNESTMLLPILISHLGWELSRSTVAGYHEELWLLLADPSYSRRPPAAPMTSEAKAPRGADAAASRAESKEDHRFPGLYL